MTPPLRTIVSAVLLAAGFGVSAVAVTGLALTASATPMVGIVLQSGGAARGHLPPAASENQLGSVDSYEETLDRSFDPLTADPRAVIDTDRERAAFAALQEECMADAGYDWWDASRASEPWWVADKSLDEQQAVYAALHGENTGPEYRWELAGCYGHALHETGNDDNH